MTIHDLQKHRERTNEIGQMRSMMNSQLCTAVMEQYRKMIDEYDDEAIRIECKMDLLTSDERAVIRFYYLDKDMKTWEKVSELTNFSIRHVFRLRKSALKKLKDGEK